MHNFTYMKYLIISLICFPLLSQSQDNYEKAVIETKYGGLIIFSQENNSFIIELDTADIEIQDNPQSVFLTVDKSYILQLFTLQFQNPNNKDLSKEDNFFISIFRI